MNQDGIMPLNTSTENRFQYNGKELEKDGGGDLSDYGARWYDASVGRFMGVDPIADEFASVSPFNYAENEPVGHIDLWGLQAYKDLGGPRDAGMHSTAETYKEDNAVFNEAFLKSSVAGVLTLPAVIVSAPAIISAAPAAIRTYAINAGETLAFESAASLLTEGNLSQVDMADVTVGGIGFWGGVFVGSMVDAKLDGTFAYADFLGGTKDKGAVALDVGLGVVGYGINKGLATLNNRVLGALGGTINDYSYQIGRWNSDHIKANSEYNKYLLERMSNALGKSSIFGKSIAKSKSFLTPYFQKRFNNGRK